MLNKQKQTKYAIYAYIYQICNICKNISNMQHMQKHIKYATYAKTYNICNICKKNTKICKNMHKHTIYGLLHIYALYAQVRVDPQKPNRVVCIFSMFSYLFAVYAEK